MNNDISNQFDPFNTVLGFAAATNISDWFIQVFTMAGISFDHNLTTKQDRSNTYRIRALRPRVVEAYNVLTKEARLAAANAALDRLLVIGKQSGTQNPGTNEGDIIAALNKIGWDYVGICRIK